MSIASEIIRGNTTHRCAGTIDYDVVIEECEQLYINKNIYLGKTAYCFEDDSGMMVYNNGEIEEM